MVENHLIRQLLFCLVTFPIKNSESQPRFFAYLFKKIKNSFKFFSLSFVRSFLPEADLSSNKGIIDNVEDVAVVVLKEEKGFLKPKIKKVN